MSETPEVVDPQVVDPQVVDPQVVDPEVDRDWDSDVLGSMADFADDTEPELEEGDE